MSGPGGQTQRRKRETREDRLAAVARAIEAGELTIRQATPDDLSRLEAERQRRDRAAGAPTVVGKW